MRLPDWKTLSNSVLSENAVRPATIAANLVLLILLAYSAAQLTWSLAVSPPDTAPAGALGGSDDTTAAQPRASLSSAQEIADLHLFGRAGVITATPRPAEVPETKLNLVLRAVVAGDAETARAIISDPSGNENFYAVGAQLPGGAELREIHASHIILFRGGRLETLRLPKDTLDLAAEIAEEVQRDQQSAGAMSPRDYREALANNPESLADVVRVEPYMENGEFRGYRLSPGRDPDFFRQFGLEENDVITAVNGITIDNPVKGGVVLRALMTAEEVSIDIMRDGTPHSMVISLN